MGGFLTSWSRGGGSLSLGRLSGSSGGGGRRVSSASGRSLGLLEHGLELSLQVVECIGS